MKCGTRREDADRIREEMAEQKATGKDKDKDKDKDSPQAPYWRVAQFFSGTDSFSPFVFCGCPTKTGLPHRVSSLVFPGSLN